MNTRYGLRSGVLFSWLVALGTLLSWSQSVLGPGTAAAQGPDLQNGDIFVSDAEGANNSGLIGPRLIWRVRNGVAERYAEGAPDSSDNAFFEVP